MQIGYYFWGFLGDHKFNNKGDIITAPDGNQIYSWAIIKELQDKGNNVTIFHDRDAIGYKKLGSKLFGAFEETIRNDVYLKCIKSSVNKLNKTKLDLVLIEWRWIMNGRNDPKTKVDNPKVYQNDYEDMVVLIDYCNKNKIPFVVYDLDYKLTKEDIKRFNIKYVLDPGLKIKNIVNDRIIVRRVYQPFDFSSIDYFNIADKSKATYDTIYIGNEYERNWAVKKYLPDSTNIWGNWLEPAHIESARQFPKLKFHNRINACDIPSIYQQAISTVLLAREDYAKYQFVTPRATEAIFYGVVPFFIKEFGEETIGKFAGKYAKFLTVHSKSEVKRKVRYLKKHEDMIYDIINYLRLNMRFTDVKFFVNELMSCKKLDNTVTFVKNAAKKKK